MSKQSLTFHAVLPRLYKYLFCGIYHCVLLAECFLLKFPSTVGEKVQGTGNCQDSDYWLVFHKILLISRRVEVPIQLVLKK